MSLGVFSDFSKNVAANSPITKKEVEQKPATTVAQVPVKKSFADTVKTVAPIVIPLVAIPITAGITYKLSTKSVAGLKTDMQALTKELANLKVQYEQQSKVLTDTLKKQASKNKKANAQIWSAIIAAAGLSTSYTAGKLTKDQKKEVAQSLSNRVSSIDSRSSRALSSAEQSMALTGNSLGKKYTKNINGVQLLQNTNSLTKNAQKYDKALQTIKSAAPKRLYEAPDAMPLTVENPTIWSVTSEFAPIKEGGLGSVPVEVQNNVTKLGVNIPTFIPMYQQRGRAIFRQENGEYIYTYKKDFKLKKAASFKMDTYSLVSAR